jgi:N utilization substance protein B
MDTDFDPEADAGLAEFPTTDDRSYARRVALQILYEVDSAGHDATEVMNQHLSSRDLTSRAARYTAFLVKGVDRHRDAIDPVIRRLAPEFPLELLAIIDRNILRMAMLEFAVERRTPVGVAIDEAVELSKLFGADNTPSFVNGVLGALADNSELMQVLNDAGAAAADPGADPE